MDSNQIVEVQILNAFVDNNTGGNPAGVVLDADDLSTKQKLKIAKAVGLSETAFVSTSETADFKLDFFTPNKQIAHCGHATIATFSYLSQLGKIPNPITSKETIDGNRKVNISNGLAFMEQKAPSYTNVSGRKREILASLSLNEENLLEGAFFIIPVADAQILKNVQPNFDLINQLSEEFDLIGYYVFTLDVDEKDRDVTTRMFAPRYGIEDMIQQGKFMNPASVSLIITELDIVDNKIKGLMAGGKGIAISKRIIDLSE